MADPEQLKSEQWRLAMQKWDEVDVEYLANVFFEECCGDARKLLRSHRDPGEIYGRISQKVFGMNTTFVRSTLWVFWTENRKHIRELYLRRKYPRTKNPEKLLRVNPRIDIPSERWCWCKGDITGLSIQCAGDKCGHQKYHVECCGLSEEAVLGEEPFYCLICLGSPRLPELWKDTGERTKHPRCRLDLQTDPSMTPIVSAPRRRTILDAEFRKQLVGDERLRRESPSVRSMLPAVTTTMDREDGSEEDDSEIATPILRRSIPNSNVQPTGFEVQLSHVSQETYLVRGGLHGRMGHSISGARTGTNPAKQDLLPVSTALSHDGGSESENEELDLNTRVAQRALPEFPRRKSVESQATADRGSKSVDSDFIHHQDEDPAAHVTTGDFKESDKDFVDASDVPMTFEIIMSMQDWNEIIQRTVDATGRSSYVATNEYPRVLQPYFSKKNPVCVLVGLKKTHRHPLPPASLGAYYIARTRCASKTCEAKYVFTVRGQPLSTDSEVKIEVKGSGKILHEKDVRVIGQLRGKQRTAVKKLQETKTSAAIRRLMFADADQRQLQFFNYNMTKNLTVLQKANYERNHEGDFHEDHIMDLILTHFEQRARRKSKRPPGFIQLISLVPFAVVMFCEEQLKLMKALTNKREVTLFLDATGTLAKRLPLPFSQTTVYYYALVVKPVDKETAVPVAEFFTAAHDANTIEMCLRSFVHTYKTLWNVRGKGLGIARIEIDFSKALLAAAASVFQRGDVEEYIHFMHFALAPPQPTNPSYFGKPNIAIHVCRLHALRFWYRKIDRLFPRSRKDAGEYFKDWMRRFVRASTLHGIVRRICDLLVVSGNDFYTTEVSDRITAGGTPSYDMLDISAFLNRAELDYRSKEPFYKRSVFGKIGLTINDLITTINEQVQDDIAAGAAFQPNPYKSDVLRNYALVHIIPYSPILTQSVFRVFGQPVDDDTTNHVENWIGLLKNNLLQGKRYVRIAALIRETEKLIEGSAVQALAAISGLAEDVPTQLESDDSEYEGIDPLIGSTGDQQDDELDGTHAKEGSRSDVRSPEKGREVWGAKKGPGRRPVSHPVLGMPVIPTGACFEDENGTHSIVNTCNVDTTLQLLYYFWQYHSVGRTFIQPRLTGTGFASTISRILGAIDDEDFDMARIIYLADVLKLSLSDKIINIEGSESENGTSRLAPWLSVVERVRKCQNRNCRMMTRKRVSMTEIKGTNPQDILRKYHDGEIRENWCRQCHQTCKINYNLMEFPEILVYTCDGLVNNVKTGKPKNMAKEKDLQLRQTLSGQDYEVAAYTIYTGNHFYCVILCDGKRYTADGQGLHVKPRSQMADSHPISSVWLVKKD